jgi:hypothetical protein
LAAVSTKKLLRSLKGDGASSTYRRLPTPDFSLFKEGGGLVSEHRRL